MMETRRSLRRRSSVNPILLAAVPATHSSHQIQEDFDMETRRSMRRRSSLFNPILLAAISASSSSYQIQEDFDFDLHDLSTDDVQFILNRKGYKYHYKNEFHRQISYKIAIHGVKVFS